MSQVPRAVKVFGYGVANLAAFFGTFSFGVECVLYNYLKPKVVERLQEGLETKNISARPCVSLDCPRCGKEVTTTVTEVFEKAEEQGVL